MALATEPGLLLLDGPVSAVDVGAKAQLRRVLRQQLATTPAMALADRLVVLEGGRVTQEGPLRAVTTQPRSAWVARLAGLNLFRGRVDARRLLLDDGSVITVATDVRGPAFAHPRAVSPHRARPEGGARNAWAGEAAGPGTWRATGCRAAAGRGRPRWGSH